MQSKVQQLKTLLRTVPRLKMFWVLEFGQIFFLLGFFWFLLRVYGLGLLWCMIGFVLIGFINSIICLLSCFQFQVGSLAGAALNEDTRRDLALREVIVGAPIILAGGVMIYLIIINRIDQITYVGIPAIMLWAVLRRLIPKK